jgi:UDP-glucose 4-epimerase
MYLITGGCGFIGGHLAEALLAEGEAVRVLDNLSSGKRENLPPEAALQLGDVCDPAALAKAMQGVKGVFHLAAIASVDIAREQWLASHRVNVGGTVAVLEAAREACVPVVYASSAAVYGNPQGMEAIVETHPTRPISAYGVDKLASEWHASLAAGQGFSTVGLRFFNVYGPRQDPTSMYSGVIAKFLARIAKGEAVDIYGDGQQSRDFIYVADIVQGCVSAMRWAAAQTVAKSEVVNVCTGRSTTVQSLAETIAEVTHQPLQVQTQPAKLGDIRDSLGCAKKALSLLGFEAKVGLREGLATMVGVG